MIAWTRPAEAYAWMIRHDYTSCAQCHADPSGGSLLTPYGRAQGELLLRSQYGKQADDAEPGKMKDFLWGLIPLPEPTILLGGDVRNAYLAAREKAGDAPAGTDNRFISMQADFTGQVMVDRFRANASIGFDYKGAQSNAITHRDEYNLISRVHWVGVDLGEDKQWLVRAGRMNMPFGIRQIEHTLFVRDLTRTDTKGGADHSAQQHGVSLSYNAEGIRGELMAILGNYQLNPDAFRERGYAGYIEWAPMTTLAFGASSLVTHASRDLRLGTELTRQAHGVFGRYSPIQPLVLTAEADFLINTQPGNGAGGGTHAGFASFLQGDYEAWQGLHFILTGETKRDGLANTNWSYGGWAGCAWFFAPHADIRVDGMLHHLDRSGIGSTATTFLAQFHLYL
ncbi:OprO/OprP family phosphate-selective porin [Pendulispora rubella]|uniref:OprO/OprP family phosphate-selective porin n=1 Tax=Pendulispora rubella TaxID=2741070 RepID=A0ABZ2LF86_9BACT